jgi:branched-chain amino acid transport system substrate-binding protein
MQDVRRRIANAQQVILTLAAALMFGAAAMSCARAADPIRIGFGLDITGGSAPTGKQLLVALQVWRDDVNAKGGLLGRPVEFVYYDDQSNPANSPGIYTKLIDVDKVDLIIGPYGTNVISAAMPVIMQHNLMTVGMMGLGVNAQFKYSRYFSILPLGSNAKLAFSEGFFDLAKAQNPRPKTLAIIAVDAEFGKTTSDGARENAKAAGFYIVYDRSYPPSTVDFSPIMRAVQAANPDVVFVGAYPPDTVGIIHAADEVGLKPKMFGGAMIGLTATVFKAQLGPLTDGLVVNEVFVPAPSLNFPGLQDVMKKYQAQAPSQKIDPLGYGFAPFGYAAGQVLAQSVEATKSLDAAKLADYAHSHSFQTVVGEISFGEDGEWRKARDVFTQFQNVKPNDINQFRDTSAEVVVWPPTYKTGNFIYPYTDAHK